MPTTAEDAKAAGFTQEQIDEYMKKSKAVDVQVDANSKPKEKTTTDTDDKSKQSVEASSNTPQSVNTSTNPVKTSDDTTASKAENPGDGSTSAGVKEAVVDTEGGKKNTETAAAPVDEGSSKDGVAAAGPTLEELHALFSVTPPPADTTRKIRVKYSRYNDEFECRNGVLRWRDMDDEYAISFVFKGAIIVQK